MGAIFEAGNQHHRGIAFSTTPENLEGATEYLEQAYNFIIENNLFQYTDLYNVNIPETVKGIRITKQGNAFFSDSFFKVDENTYTQHGEMIADTNADDLDRDSIAFSNGYISVTPMTKERTDLVAFEKLKSLDI
jgi:broad specificity polyphosphatase/5'/3'-nucleotidase SurE